MKNIQSPFITSFLAVSVLPMLPLVSLRLEVTTLLPAGPEPIAALG